MENFNLDNQIERLAKTVQFRVGKAIKKYSVETTTDETVKINITKTFELNYTIIFNFREGLRWTDMGAGSGYHKGKGLSRNNYEFGIEKFKTARRPKPIINRKIFWMINSLREVGSLKIVDETINSFTLNLTAPNVSN